MLLVAVELLVVIVITMVVRVGPDVTVFVVLAIRISVFSRF